MMWSMCHSLLFSQHIPSTTMNNNKADKKPSKRMQLVLPHWLADEIQKKADELGMNLSEVIREAVREFVKK